MAIDIFSITRKALSRRSDRRMLAKLARHDPHLIRDMGFEPAAVYSALQGTWDELPGNLYRGFENG